MRHRIPDEGLDYGLESIDENGNAFAEVMAMPNALECPEMMAGMTGEQVG